MNVDVKYTYKDLLTTPDDGNRYEIFEGELTITPAPNTAHQIAVINLIKLISHHVDPLNLGRLFSAPIDVYFDDETVVEPDLLFVSRERLHIIDEQKVNGAPDVVIEIISESTESRDRGFKFKLYAREGVKEYWIIDPTKKTVEVYQLTEKKGTLTGKFTNNDALQSPYFSGLLFSVNEVWK